MRADELSPLSTTTEAPVAAAPTAPLIVLVGPTASGKSALGIELAERLDGEIINADSMQLYQGMDIGTAKVTPDEAGAVPHHLFDVLDVTREASVADFQEQARRVIGEIRARGKTPIMVGGSGLYVRAVIDVIEFPPTDPELRSRLTRRLEEQGAAPLRLELRELDPESAAVIKDDRRLIRALEVVLLTGRTFSSFMPQRIHEPSLEPVVQLGLDVDRSLLHQRIAHRVQRMEEQGLLEEVRRLDDAGLRRGRTAPRAIGYQQFLQVLDDELSLAEAIESTTTATRKFARRQETWFRADPRVTWLPAPSEDLCGQALEAIRRAQR
ncbi:tRNA delta(2)-isopentenylpyrophosphate transferase [Nesterenkonia sp. AN1]|uniref:tRNA dimethylallyltransferase n=1 Tax=Nesterenkonia aurantiaca TaxID=1436010 RepID=A0A4R7G3L7_9MICC|nr:MULTISPECIES: tRNA (adenosine(37)-N6)-dimethylallyltransferase MiaA [Nesterenkonia]EXF25251.1 tRNA delta(2)-isopentenylpyrophosphate transferase [Nesterenkonia sp. AN1]TDS85700.1 tRNA dimethylallyltransferase [Nesterenkonia aurantiaca]